MQISNLGPEDWSLGGVNIGFLYDASAAQYILESAEIINNTDMDYALGTIQHNVISAPTLTDVPFNETLGFLRISIVSNVVSNGLQLKADSSWVSFFNICFDIILDDITNPNTCFQMNFINENLRNSGIFPVDIVQELNFNGPGDDVLPEINVNLLPDRSLDACFVIEEDSVELCEDGIDNDEDGLIDCEDSGCSTLCAEDNSITCNDGIDNDGDGLIDCEDEECSPLFDSFSPFEPNNCPILDNGQFEFSFLADSVEISIDSGITYMTNSVVQNLSPGTYFVFYKNVATDCIEESSFNPVILLASQECTEFSESECSDGLDNDGDGLIDCEDSECGLLAICFEINTESSTSACRDGIDNDDDGLLDCDDDDCRFFDFCRSSETKEEDLIYMPSAFSVNRNNGNDRLMPFVKNDEILDILFYSIYDRNGNRVFDKRNVLSNSSELIWDGKMSGQEVESGVYIYIIQVMKENVAQTFTGDITLLK